MTNSSAENGAERLECVRLVGAFGLVARVLAVRKREQAPRNPDADASSAGFGKRLRGAFGVRPACRRFRIGREAVGSAEAGASSTHSKRWREFRPPGREWRR